MVVVVSLFLCFSVSLLLSLLVCLIISLSVCLSVFVSSVLASLVFACCCVIDIVIVVVIIIIMNIILGSIVVSHRHLFHSVGVWAQTLRALSFRRLHCIVGVMPVTAKSKAKRAAQVRQSNARRDAKFTAVRSLNSLAEGISLPGHRVRVRDARDEDVERLVRLFEVRLATGPPLTSLRAAAQMWTDNGGVFSTPVLEEDFSTPSPLGRHRVLLPTFKLKSKAFMLTYNGASITATSFNAFKTFVVSL